MLENYRYGRRAKALLGITLHGLAQGFSKRLEGFRIRVGRYESPRMVGTGSSEGAFSKLDMGSRQPKMDLTSDWAVRCEVTHNYREDDSRLRRMALAREARLNSTKSWSQEFWGKVEIQTSRVRYDGNREEQRLAA